MKLSIIIPVYGVEKFIVHCAKSLFNQSGADLEFIFINDATKDSSIELLKDLISKEFPTLQNQVTIIDKPQNEGLPQARKTGIEHATGDYIMHCDSDDWLAENAVSTIVEKIKETSADIIYYNYHNSNDKKHEVSHEVVFNNPIEYAKAIMSFSPTSGGYCWNKVIKRSLYQRVEEWPTQNMHEDIALMSQIILQAKTMAFIESPLYHYRVTSAASMSIDFQKNKEKKIQSYSNQLILIDFLRRHHLVTEFKYQYQQLIVRCAYIAVFFDKSLIEKGPYYNALWKYPLFFNFDVSLRKQIQSRIVIALHQFCSIFQ
jgi:glycosyltransferase involved in cell wall biosynthesis